MLSDERWAGERHPLIPVLMRLASDGALWERVRGGRLASSQKPGSTPGCWTLGEIVLRRLGLFILRRDRSALNGL